jgi:hypothetical protein
VRRWGLISPLILLICELQPYFSSSHSGSFSSSTLFNKIAHCLTSIISFITTSLPLRRQGLAGGLVNSILQLAIAFFLGLAEVIATQTEHQGARRSYKIVFWYEVAIAAVALVLFVGFVKIDRAKSTMTVDEMEEMEGDGG